MIRRAVTILAAVLGPALLATCSKQVKDDEARKYIRDVLAPYLDSAAYQVCTVKYAAAPAAPGRKVCPGSGTQGAKAPTNGAVGTGTQKDSLLRVYVRDELQPWLDSFAYQLCHLKSRAAPAAPGRVICPGPPDGYTKPPPNGNP
jgi:hypothetical protein